MTKGKKRLFKILLVFIIVVAGHPLWLPLPAKFLIVKDNIKKADAILVLSGDWGFDRENKAIELYKNGLSKKIIRMLELSEPSWFHVTRTLLNLDVGQRGLYGAYFESKGVPKEALILGDAIATSTFDELKAAKDIILRNDYKSIILITSDYHMFRSLMTARWVFRGSNVEMYIASAYSKDFSPDRWWLHEEAIREVIFEYLCIFYYVSYHFMLGK